MTASVAELPRRHEPRPDAERAVSIKTGKPASMLDQAAYPIATVCKECGFPVTSVSFYMAFYHDDPPPG